MFPRGGKSVFRIRSLFLSKLRIRNQPMKGCGTGIRITEIRIWIAMYCKKEEKLFSFFLLLKIYLCKHSNGFYAYIIRRFLYTPVTVARSVSGSESGSESGGAALTTILADLPPRRPSLLIFWQATLVASSHTTTQISVYAKIIQYTVILYYLCVYVNIQESK